MTMSGISKSPIMTGTTIAAIETGFDPREPPLEALGDADELALMLVPLKGWVGTRAASNPSEMLLTWPHGDIPNGPWTIEGDRRASGVERKVDRDTKLAINFHDESDRMISLVPSA
jgi:hypothetical protein